MNPRSKYFKEYYLKNKDAILKRLNDQRIEHRKLSLTEKREIIRDKFNLKRNQDE